MKKIFCFTILLSALSFGANAQLKNSYKKKNNDFFRYLPQNQNLKSQTQNSGIKINPYWMDVDAPHTYNSFMPQVKVPCVNAVWGIIAYDTVNNGKTFLHTADGGKSWLYDTVEAPASYGLGSIAATDANTCYASMNDMTGLGGGIFKTADGGVTWNQLGVGKIFNATSYVDFVYFFDAKHGLAVGDNNSADTATLEMYTTADAGKTWQPVSKQNIPPTIGMAYSFNFNVYTVSDNRIWFKAYDNLGNLYLYRSDDFGHNWQLFPVNFQEFFYDFAFADKLNGLAVGFDFGIGPHVSETHDGGATWSEKSFTGYPMGGFVTVIPHTHTFVSTLPAYTPVYGSSYSNDYGATWKLIDTGINAEHTALAFFNPLVGWTGRGGSFDINGGMFKAKYDFSLSDESTSPSSIAKMNVANTNNVRLYPNPAKDVLRVDGLHASAKTTLSLFTISGKLLQQSVATGESYTFNIQKLATGNYYITMQSDKKITTVKFIKE